MAYQVKRSAKVEEDLELLSADGERTEVIHVKLDAGAVADRVAKNYTELLNIQSKISKMSEGEDKVHLFEELGDAVITLFQTLFGVDNTNRIIQFYEEDYIDMCRTITPFITQVIIPKIRKEVQNSRKSKIKSYDRKKGFMRKH